MVRRIVFLMAVLFALPSAGQATLLSIDDPTFGAGALTLDTKTGLEFLDLTITRNSSYVQTVGQLTGGGRYVGYRYATLPEVTSLFADAGVAITSTAQYNPAEFAAGESLLSLLGTVYTSTGNLAMTAGLTGTTSGASLVDTVSLTDCYTSAPVCIATSVIPNSTDAQSGTYSNSRAYTYLGSFLVVIPVLQAIPEPSSLALLAAGLVGAGASARRRLRQV